MTKHCEAVKIKLSDEYEANIKLHNLARGMDYNATLTREKFEELAEEVFKRLEAPIEEMLAST